MKGRPRKARSEGAAIVGMACRFPGAADLCAFWENIVAGRSAISDVPADRWPPLEFVGPDADALPEARVSSARGGYLDSPVPFDPAAHGVMPLAAEGAEPEQFLVLDAARAALTDAGLAGGVPDGRRVEVVIGRGNYFNRGNLTRLQRGRILAQTVAVARALRPDLSEDEMKLLRADLAAGLPPFGAETIPGQLTNATAGRVANRLDLRGASFVVDAASASSLVALDLGMRALAEGRADFAIVGGVYIQSDVDFPMVFSRLGALSKSGASRPFAADADGMVPGEGVGIVVLRRLSDAGRDGDRIYAVVKGVGIASDGKGLGLAAPSERGHALAMRRAYRRAGVEPAEVGLIEGHGLGVPAADRAELRALRAVFSPSRDRVLGAVSSNIGHAMPASGIAGLIKAALALHHRALPPTPGVESPHPLLLDARAPGALRRSAGPWIQGDPASRRIAGVNAFGFAGINAHAVLEEHTPSADGEGPGCLATWETEAILLDAPDREALLRAAESLAGRLARRPDVALKDLAATLNARVVGGSGRARLGLVVGSIEELRARLGSVADRLRDPKCRSIRDGRGTYFRDDPAPPEPLAVLFPGEGSQYPGMLADLCLHFPSVRALFDTSDRVAAASGAADLPSRLLFGEGASAEKLWAIGPAVNVVLSSQWALYGLVTRLGIVPDAVVGHSSGELLALAASGAIAFGPAFSDAMGGLGAVFEGLESSGELPEARLLAVAADRAKVEALAEGLPVAVAIDNCPHQVVVAGPPREVAELEARLKRAALLFETLPFSRAYHTPAFAGLVGPVRSMLREHVTSVPSIPIFSCASAAPMPGDLEGVRALAVDQWSRPVRFRETIERIYADGYRVFLDVGGRGHLAGFVEDILRGRPATALAAHTPRRPGPTQLNHLVATLFSLGHAPRAEFLYARRRPSPVDLAADAPPPPRRTLALGFPEMRVSDAMAARLRLSTPPPDEATRPPSDPAGLEPDAPAPAYIASINGSSSAYARWANGFAPDDASPPVNGTTSPFESLPGNGSGLARGHVPVNGVATAEGEWPAPGAPPDGDDEVMHDYLRTMDAFLATQREVMAGYLAEGWADATPPAAVIEPLCPGPWAGEVVSIIEGREVVTRYRLVAAGDPVAEHHTLGGRRISAVDPTRLGLPVLPFAVMAEMLAQAASILAPEGTLVALRDVTAHRWIRYEDRPVGLEIEARRDPDRPDEVRVAIFNRGPLDDLRPREAPVVEGVAVFGAHRPAAGPAEPFALADPRPSKFAADEIYRDQWLFHGPALRAVVRIGETNDEGIEGTLRVLPRGELLRDPGEAHRLHTDPIILDNFTHLLGCWGLDRLDGGDVVFPLRMGELTLLGPDPLEGEEVECRIRITRVERRRLGVEAEVVRADGTAWMRIRGWEDWRFHWPSRYRDVFRRPDVELLGEELPLGPRAPEAACAVWLQPPDDMGRPVWRDVLEQTQLAPEEKPEVASGPDARRTARLWGKVAAKDAARRLWLDRGVPPLYPADLAIRPDENGRPVLRPLVEVRGVGVPTVSISHTEGIAVALASLDPSARPGIDVERVVPRTSGFEELAFSPAERRLLDAAVQESGLGRDEWIARSWCAKEAAAKSSGLGMLGGPKGVEVVGLDAAAETLRVAFGPAYADVGGRAPGPIRVRTARRGEHAWAWTLGERSDAE